MRPCSSPEVITVMSKVFLQRSLKGISQRCPYGAERELFLTYVVWSVRAGVLCYVTHIFMNRKEYSTLDGVFPAFLTIDGSCFQSNPHWFPEAEIQHLLKWNKAFISQCMLDRWKGHSIEKQRYHKLQAHRNQGCSREVRDWNWDQMLSALNDSPSFLFCRSLSMKLEQWLLPIASGSISYQHRYPQEGTFLPAVGVVQLLSYVQLFVTPWTAAYQAPLSFTIS